MKPFATSLLLITSACFHSPGEKLIWEHDKPKVPDQCVNVCRHARDIWMTTKAAHNVCVLAKPRPNGATCEHACALYDAQDNPFDYACIYASKTCQEMDKC